MSSHTLSALAMITSGAALALAGSVIAAWWRQRRLRGSLLRLAGVVRDSRESNTAELAHWLATLGLASDAAGASAERIVAARQGAIGASAAAFLAPSATTLESVRERLSALEASYRESLSGLAKIPEEAGTVPREDGVATESEASRVPAGDRAQGGGDDADETAGTVTAPPPEEPAARLQEALRSAREQISRLQDEYAALYEHTHGTAQEEAAGNDAGGSRRPAGTAAPRPADAQAERRPGSPAAGIDIAETDAGVEVR